MQPAFIVSYLSVAVFSVLPAFGRRQAYQLLSHFLAPLSISNMFSCIMHEVPKAQVYLLRPDVAPVSHWAQLGRLLPSRAVYHSVLQHHENKALHRFTFAEVKCWPKAALVWEISTLHQVERWLNLAHSQVFSALCTLCVAWMTDFGDLRVTDWPTPHWKVHGVFDLEEIAVLIGWRCVFSSIVSHEVRIDRSKHQGGRLCVFKVSLETLDLISNPTDCIYLAWMQ